jgi:molybdenum cofactor synthesis domain-containing protein
VVAEKLVMDERSAIAGAIAEWADEAAAEVILTTGGTGIAPRDVTPEATASVLEREIPGISELMRSRGMEQTKYSVLSRAVAGSRKRALIVNLPGSPSGAVFSLKVIEHLVPHLVNLLHGITQH